MNTDQQDYIAILEHILTPNRLKHSLGVMQVMGERAGVYSLDRGKALTTGLLHDAAKDLTPAQQEQMIQEGRITIADPSERDYSLYLHGPVGAYFVRKTFGIADPLILDTIYNHTFCDNGSNFHHPLSWCLRFSDVLEPNRVWDGRAGPMAEGAPLLRRLAFAGRLEEAALLHCGMIPRFFAWNGWPVSPNYNRVYQELAKAMKNGSEIV